MSSYERQLKMFLDKHRSGVKIIHSDDPEISTDDMLVLNTKELISLEPVGENQYFIRLTGKALCYFEDKRAESIRYWADHILRFIFGFISGLAVGVLSALLLKLFQQ